MNIKTSEFFCNLKTLPPKGSREFEQLVDWEIEKCLGGVNVNGVHISNWLYFHLNHWYIRVDGKDKYGNDVRVKSHPYLRDNEWERAEALEKCRRQSKGYMEIGLRQGGKSEFEASVTGWSALMFENTQNVIVGGNSPDLQLLTDKLDFGLKNMWEGIAIGKIDNDWRKAQVRLGVKDSSNENFIWSYIMIRNAQEGHNTEAPAGTTAKSFIMDEVGKYLFSQVFEAAKPAFLSEFGWRCIPILVGTGGSFDNGADAERIFYHPEANNFLAFDHEDGSKTCLFMPGTYRQDCKYDSNLADYLRKVKGLELKNSGELEKIPMKVSDKEKALEKIKEERARKAKDPDQVEYLKAVMYYPLTAQECFLSATRNMFNIQEAKKQKEKLSQLNITGTPIEIYHDEQGRLTHKFTDKRPISTFPLKDRENKDGVVVMYEAPVSNAPFGLYVAGVDPYKQDIAKYSDSLGACYIYKRTHNITEEKYQDMIVAQYVGRPQSIATWNETVRNLIKYYNAYTLAESEDYGFIQYMINKGETMYLMPQPAWLTDIAQTSIKRPYGIPSPPRIVNHLNGILKLYTEEVTSKIFDEQGNLVREVLGFSKILDPLLLEEIIKFNPDGNFDRIRAASIAIEVARRLDEEKIKVSTTETDPRLKSYFSTKPNRSVLGKCRKKFIRNKRKSFYGNH